MNTDSPRIAIIGGGLGGLSLAICLLHHDVPFHLYEAAPSFGEIGAGIMCGPHTVNALRLISPDALAAFQKCVTFNQEPNDSTRWRWGTYRFGMDARYKSNKKMGDVEREVYPTEEVRKRSELCGTRTMSSVHRARFLEEMVKLLPDGVASFNKVFSRLEEQDQEVILYFTDGTEVRVDAVVGCDGIKSKVRLSMMKGIGQVVEPQYVGEYAYRSLVDATIAKAILGEQLAANCNVWEGYGGYIIHYPIEGGRMINVVGVKQDTGPAREHSSEQLVNPVPRKTMDRDWKDWDPRLQRLLQEFKTSDQWSLWSLQHDQKYFRGRVCVMGDAAHATAPHLGSGAGMAIEDAYILGSLLALVKTKTDLEIAFAEYDAIRRPRTQQLIAKSKDAGKKLCFALTGIEDDFEALQAYSESQFRWIWELDLEQQLQEAKEIYERSRAA